MYRDLHEFIAELDRQQELARIRAPLSPALEISEVIDRVCKGPAERNHALLFESVPGHDLSVAANLFGSQRRMALALGVERLDDLGDRLGQLLDFRLPQGLGGMLGRGQDMLSALRAIGLGPSKVRSGPVQEIIEKDTARLSSLPVLTCWPEDGGAFITLPQVITRDPETGARNVGMYRLQVIDDRRLLMHWQRHKGGAEHERVARIQAKATIPAAVVLGGDPAAMWCASAPLPPNIDEYLLAGWIRGKPVEFVDCQTIPLEAPAQAEIIIEGYVDPNTHLPEGPFGDHTGYYTPVEPFPVFNVTAITRRREAIYPATLVGIPPMEDVWMGKATERLFLPLIRLFLPEVVDVAMPPAGVFHNLVLVSIRKRYPGQARKVIQGLWGLGLLMLAKAIVVVDEWVDVQDLNQAAWQALGNVDWSRDILVTQGPVDHLDHASAQHSFGGKIGIDATAKSAEEGHPRPWPQPVGMKPEVRAHVDAIWKSLGLD